MPHFSSVGASQPVLSGKKPDKQLDVRTCGHFAGMRKEGVCGEPSRPISAHFVLSFFSPSTTVPCLILLSNRFACDMCSMPMYICIHTFLMASLIVYSGIFTFLRVKTIKLSHSFLSFLQGSWPSGFETQVCQKNLQTHAIGVSPDMGLGANFCKSLPQTRAVVVVARPTCPLSSDVPTTVRRQSTTDNHDQQLQSRGKITINNREP